MKCRFCKAKIQKYHKTCPQCGKRDPQPETNAAFLSMRRTAIMFGSIAALAALAVTLLIAMLGGWNIGNSFGWLKPRENNVYYKNSYTVSTNKAFRNRDEVIGTLGGTELSNGQLQIYYWMQVYDFISNYGDSAANLGLDYTADMSKQTYTDGTTTWQQYFLKSALQVWQSNQAFALLAQENGFTLSEEDQKYLDELEKMLEESALEGGYADADAMVQADLGGGCNAEDYAQYLRVYYLGYKYFTHLYGQIELTREEVEAYYQENLEKFTEAGVVKSDALYVAMRHILVIPQGGIVQSDGTKTYTQTAWDECKAEAERILRQWKNGERTEESFTELGMNYAQEDASTYTGGLYTNLVKGDLETSLDTWCFDSSRKVGDYGLVKSSYGYHIVYFVEAEEIWYSEAEADLREELGQEMVDGVLAGYPMEVDYKKIKLAKPDLKS